VWDVGEMGVGGGAEGEVVDVDSLSEEERSSSQLSAKTVVEGLGVLRGFRERLVRLDSTSVDVSIGWLYMRLDTHPVGGVLRRSFFERIEYDVVRVQGAEWRKR
jgi:hypothetical protein